MRVQDEEIEEYRYCESWHLVIIESQDKES